MLTLDNLAILARDFQSWSPSQMTHFTIVIFSALATGFLYRFLSGSPLITVAAAALVLYFCAMAANFLGREIPMEGATEFQRAAFFSVIGHSVGAFVLLFLFKAAERGR